ncbi:DUF6708 domain-containing protein [Achromobacter sp. RTa]|uniref:DUF6708 domain-containing protein n=1 Tax=Achromobacter sp. RTa TaxID=1532557 RepID=UPI00068970EC|nr:DUF6708 domain-containing protein [Achromobacter sp. RTa]
MLTGWYPTFRLNRPLEPEERQQHLAYKAAQPVVPDDELGMIRFNSTFLEFVNRTFKVKGMAATLVSGVAAIGFVLFNAILAIVSYGRYAAGGYTLNEYVLATAFLTVLTSGLAYFFWRIHLRNDLFAYTYYPVRFNRKTRQVHFFVHEGAGGTVTVPWGDASVFFHIGRGSQNRELRDLRCHVLKDDQVTQTFTVGHYWWHENRVRGEWELIRRYMEDGPENAFDHPQDRVITLSPQGSWLNCYMWVCHALGTDLYKFRFLLFPIYGLLTLSRWLTFKSCRKPVWPPEVEASCAIEPDDPYRLPEPTFMGEFAQDDAKYQRAAERHQQRQSWK